MSLGLLASALSLLSTAAAPPVGEVAELSGSVIIESPKGDRATVNTAGHELFEGDTIETTESAMAKVILQGPNVLTLGPKSRLTITKSLVEKDTVSTVVSLMRGKLRALVGSIFGRKVSFDTKTPNAVAGVRGTYILAETDGGSSSSFYSINGPMVVTSQGQVVTLSSGQGMHITNSGVGSVGDFTQQEAASISASTALPPSFAIGASGMALLPESRDPSTQLLFTRQVPPEASPAPLSIDVVPVTAPSGIDVSLDFTD